MKKRVAFAKFDVGICAVCRVVVRGRTLAINYSSAVEMDARVPRANSFADYLIKSGKRAGKCVFYIILFQHLEYIFITCSIDYYRTIRMGGCIREKKLGLFNIDFLCENIHQIYFIKCITKYIYLEKLLNLINHEIFYKVGNAVSQNCFMILSIIQFFLIFEPETCSIIMYEIT